MKELQILKVQNDAKVGGGDILQDSSYILFAEYAVHNAYSQNSKNHIYLYTFHPSKHILICSFVQDIQGIWKSHNLHLQKIHCLVGEAVTWTDVVNNQMMPWVGAGQGGGTHTTLSGLEDFIGKRTSGLSF